MNKFIIILVFLAVLIAVLIIEPGIVKSLESIFEMLLNII